MLRVFKHHVPKSLVILGLLEALVLMASIEFGARLRLESIDTTVTPFLERLPATLTFTAIVYIAMLAVGMYQQECCRDLRMTFIRMVAAFAGSMAVMALVFYITPQLLIWRSIAAIALIFATVGIMVTRYVFQHVVDMSVFKRGIVVLGAGKRAAKIRELERRGNSAGFRVMSYVRMRDDETEIPDAKPGEEIDSLHDFVDQLQVHELVLANEERRGTMPVSELIQCKLRGMRIFDLNQFLERETGKVELEGLQPSWIIFSDGFTFTKEANAVLKRLFDIMASLGLLILTLPILIIAALLIKLTSAGPVFYRQERIGKFGKRFNVIKFRSMYVNAEDRSGPQWAEENDPRITPIGRLLRITRIDEIPQIFNVLMGDMSFVGPRPERSVFVNELAKEIPFYAERHAVKPGITGWAQLNYPYGASVQDARAKLEYDLYYVKNFSVFLDLLILIQTVRVILWQNGVR
ncbi:MAG: TIGR03013 family PEP-CTERM/XrtA system glycosyltransferase [Sphingomonadales bacterium]|jgi:sugar transferase (PEP-CTERM system associated)